MAAAAILDFEKFKFVTVGTVKRVKLHHLVKFRQNRPKCGWDMAILKFFKMADAAILDFWNFLIFNGYYGQEVRNASPCQIWSKSVEPRLRHGVYSIFQDGGCRHLGFEKFKFLTVGTVKRFEMLHHAKFSQNRLNRSRDMAIIRFFKMAAAAILDLKNPNFKGRGGQEGRTASTCQISSKSAQMRIRYGYF